MLYTVKRIKNWNNQNNVKSWFNIPNIRIYSLFEMPHCFIFNANCNVVIPFKGSHPIQYVICVAIFF